MFFSKILFLSVENTMPRAFEDSEFHWKFLFLQYIVSVVLSDPALNTLHFFVFNFKPDIKL